MLFVYLFYFIFQKKIRIESHTDDEAEGDQNLLVTDVLDK